MTNAIIIFVVATFLTANNKLECLLSLANEFGKFEHDMTSDNWLSVTFRAKLMFNTTSTDEDYSKLREVRDYISEHAPTYAQLDIYQHLDSTSFGSDIIE